MAASSFTEVAHQRRTIRALQNSSTVADSAVIDLATSALLDVPSAFNSQTTRITALFGTDHTKLWSIVTHALLKKLGEERYNSGTRERIASFAESYGTILFWDDRIVAEKLKENSPDIYKDKIMDWVHQSNGMHQYYMWTAMAALGLGANVQHYNPLVDEEVQKTWDLPSSWELRAQMVFSAPEKGSEPGEKEQKLPLDEVLKVFGGDVLAACEKL